VSGAFAIQVGTLAKRSIVRTARQPAQFVPALVFPLFLLAINAGGLDAATGLPFFPTDSYLSFALAVPFIQGGLFAIMNGGTDLARDIETGFLNRLSLTPLRGAALIAGQLAGVVALGFLQAVFFLAVGLAAGADFESGPGGVPVLFALSLSIVFACGALGTFAALRLGNGEAVQGLFPLFFVFLFLSSMALPRDLIEQDWFQTIATANPFSYLIEGVRSLFITGWDGEALALAFGISFAMTAVFVAASAASLRLRITRT
jgi:ABC-2 type transport system permease protein